MFQGSLLRLQEMEKELFGVRQQLEAERESRNLEEAASKSGLASLMEQCQLTTIENSEVQTVF